MNTRFSPHPSTIGFKPVLSPAPGSGVFHAVHSQPERLFSPATAPKTHVSKQPANPECHVVNPVIPVSSGLGVPGIPIPLWKRIVDLTACTAALPFLGLCTLVMIVLTKRVSPGPVFFRQERIGYMGRRFKIYKFRTMRAGADCSVHQDHVSTLMRTNAPMVKLDSRGDPRLIPLGWLLRASGLDELPQLINVLRGEMSLVGPRPCLPSEFAHYKSWQRQRCDALPGLTGLWQVSGKNRTTFEQMIRLDIQYTRTCSFWLDLRIIFLTPLCLLAQLRETRHARKSSAQPVERLRTPVAQMKARSLSVKNIREPSESPADETPGLLDCLQEFQRRTSQPQAAAESTESPLP